MKDITSIESSLELLRHALLYEGYALYPYRNSALKNKTPIPFGVVYPESYCEHNEFVHDKMQTQCVVSAFPHATIAVSVKFLQINYNPGSESMWFATERTVESGEINLDSLLGSKATIPFKFSQIEDNQQEFEIFSTIEGCLFIEVFHVEGKKDLFRISSNIINSTLVENTWEMTTNEILPSAFVSTHTILKVEGGCFISDQNPPEELKDIVLENNNIATWPVLIDFENTILLSSPIILYDYPQIHSASQTDLFDSTEMDEALLLHINVLGEKEKEEISNADPKLKSMLNKIAEITPDEMIGLHDTLNNKNTNSKPGEDFMVINGIEYRKGNKIKLNLGKRRSDATDILLNGKTATIETIYTDYDGKVYLAVTIDEDPARDLEREMNIYRFFLPDEVELIQS